jgi:hypothetical protein
LTLPPEVNSERVYAGAGAGPMLAAMAAWHGLAAELRSAAASFGAVTSGLSSGQWQGPASAAMGEAAAAYVAWLGGAAARAERAAAQAQVLAGAFEAAFAEIVHPTAVAANRAQLASLARSNLFGQNAPSIAAIEAAYEQMWAQDVAAMVGYHAAASAAGSELMPWQQLRQSLSSQDSVSSTATYITVPGAAPGHFTGHETPQQYAAINAAIGENWFPGTTPKVLKYPATAGLISGRRAPTADESIASGQQMLNADILTAVASGQPVVVIGLSEGTLVVDAELAYLATAPNAPPPNMLTFVEFASPQCGLADTYFPTGLSIPGVGYTVQGPPESQYNTTMVYRQYDAWANPPDRPWHLLADVDAAVGIAYLHTSTELVSPSQVVEISSVTNSLGGTTTTYMIPTTTLPMLMPLQQIGVPSPIVNAINNVLTPIVNEGYSQFDPTGGPYFSHGHLVF